MTNSQQNLNNKADHQFGDGNDMTHAQKIEFLKTQQQMTNETNQTAVEWLEEQIIKFHNWKRNPVFDENCFDEIELNKAIKQAKEMDKIQKFHMFNCGRQYQLTGEGTFTEVYNETYGGNK